VKKIFLLRKTFTIHSPNSVDLNRQKLASEIKTPVPLAWGKSADLFLESFRKRMHQYYVGCNILYGKVSKHNFQVYRFIEGRSSLTACGRFEEISTGTMICVTVDITFDLLVGFFMPLLMICLICICYGDPGSSSIFFLGTYQVLFIVFVVTIGLLSFTKYTKTFQNELKFYRSRLIEIFE
jgi:hypothetical protein